MAILIHSTVGLQHASMAIYNAYADRVPMLILVGNIADASKRRPGVEWFHTATDVAAMVRGFIKHDAQPLSLQSFGEEITKAHAMALTPPNGPVLLTVDGDLAENPMESKTVVQPAYSRVQPAVADPAALAKVAQLLVGAQQPVIFADRVANSPETMAHLVELAELLQIPVIDSMNRPNFPNTHHLCSAFSGRQLVTQADVILALDADDLFSLVGDVPDQVERTTVLRIKPGTKVVNISSLYALGDGNFQDQQRFYQADMPIAGDSGASLPYLTEAVNRAMTSERRAQNPQRETRFRSAFMARRKADLELAAIGWEATPITVSRLCMEVWSAIKADRDGFSLVSDNTFESSWPQRLWTLDKYYHTNGGAGAYGVAYGMPSSVGAAVAVRDQGRFAVNIQGDGDLLCLPGSLWTLAHHNIPLLTVVHNNRAWHQEHMHVQRIADRRQRGLDRAHIGTVITDPYVDFARIAQGFGVYAEGPIENPSDLEPALARALKIVKSGKPALVDVVAQGR
jgi:thiamine pyrophosphate-dependent acetolactate synthase large subunit-like protein